MLGSLRGIAQTISYEISLALILFTLLAYSNSLTIEAVGNMAHRGLAILVSPFLAILWLTSCVAETNRTPFDFSEGESELVSGFNIEYGALGFTLIFMAEYSIIIFFSAVSGMVFLTPSTGKLFLGGSVVVLGFFWVWLRATYPRYRYDKLINIAWKGILPLTILLLPWGLIIAH